jgi:AraC family transcriptional regulator of adaptative response/methylated-DNA-[protein]-cysteine methyltransferase
MNIMSSRRERAAKTLCDPRWQSVLARDSNAEGAFFYSVSTTGVYCRPSCAARTARPEHVAFHDSVADAERAGFRPCKRCKPGETALAEREALMIAELCRFIDAAPEVPTLAQLAQKSGMSAYHLHRRFKAHTGLTPKAYASARRAERMREALAANRNVTAAIYDAGYNSNGRFYAEADRVLGMTPARYRSGGYDADVRFSVGRCSLGSILVAASDRGVCTIALGDDAETLTADLRRRLPHAKLIRGDESFDSLVMKVIAFVEEPGIGFNLPLDVRGTAFQRRVWQALSAIPVGKTSSYSEIAERLGAPKSVRAVAQACAANAIAVAIPCHRAIGKNGAITGYRWGVGRKAALLERERKAKRT